MNPRKNPAAWQVHVARVILALLTVGTVALLQVTGILLNQECTRNQRQLTDLTGTQACMQMNLADPQQWLGARLIIVCAVVCLLVGLALLHVWLETRWHDIHTKPAALLAQYRAVGNWLVAVIVLLLFADAMLYTNGLAQLGPQ